MSRNIAAMALSIELVDYWLFKKWPDLRELKRRKTWYNNFYFARLALADNKLGTALYYCARAYRARPAALLEQSNFEFSIALLTKMARLVGVRRPRFTKRSSPPKPRVSFKELCAASTMGVPAE
jgi:hypothetical protein